MTLNYTISGFQRTRNEVRRLHRAARAITLRQCDDRPEASVRIARGGHGLVIEIEDTDAYRFYESEQNPHACAARRTIRDLMLIAGFTFDAVRE